MKRSEYDLSPHRCVQVRRPEGVVRAERARMTVEQRAEFIEGLTDEEFDYLVERDVLVLQDDVEVPKPGVEIVQETRRTRMGLASVNFASEAAEKKARDAKLKAADFVSATVAPGGRDGAWRSQDVDALVAALEEPEE